jgi:hypothetical protein
MTRAEAKSTRTANANFLGHPKGLFYLAFTEAWERFSHYGMTALVLYMVNHLLPHGRRAAHRLRAYRRYDHHHLPVDGVLSGLQRESDLDSTACRARRWRLPNPGVLVPIDQSGFQRPMRAAGVLDLAPLGITASRA